MTGPALSQVIRYDAVARLARKASGRTLLDVGSGAFGLAALLAGEWEVTAADVDFGDYGAAPAAPPAGVRRVVADARRLPFDSRSFDVVTAVDVIEHIPPRERANALAELVRVARERVIVGFPAGARAEAGDRRLARLYRRRGIARQPWLEEHLAHGLPRRELLERGLDPLAGSRLTRNENAWAHALLMRIEAFRRGADASRQLARALLPGIGGRGARALVLAAVRGFDLPPAYRLIGVGIAADGEGAAPSEAREAG